jgi:hypothetical protein
MEVTQWEHVRPLGRDALPSQGADVGRHPPAIPSTSASRGQPKGRTVTNPHPADADYSAQNEPNLEQLSEMMDAALATAQMIAGPIVGRRFRLIPQTNPEMIGAEYAEYVQRLSPPMFSKVPVDGVARINGQPIELFRGGVTEVRDHEQVVPDYSRAIFDEAKDAAMTERIQASATDMALVTGLIEVTESRIRALREDTEIGRHPVVAHALTSMELGLLGLIKVRDDVANDAESVGGTG